MSQPIMSSESGYIRLRVVAHPARSCILADPDAHRRRRPRPRRQQTARCPQSGHGLGRRIHQRTHLRRTPAQGDIVAPTIVVHPRDACSACHAAQAKMAPDAHGRRTLGSDGGSSDGTAIPVTVVDGVDVTRLGPRPRGAAARQGRTAQFYCVLDEKVVCRRSRPASDDRKDEMPILDLRAGVQAAHNLPIPGEGGNREEPVGDLILAVPVRWIAPGVRLQYSPSSLNTGRGSSRFDIGLGFRWLRAWVPSLKPEPSGGPRPSTQVHHQFRFP